MASVQCHKPDEKTSCHQGHQEQSLGQKVSELASSIFKGKGSHHSQAQGHCPHNTTSHTNPNQCTTQTNGHASGAMACQGKTKSRRSGEKKKIGLLQKIKDGISDDSSSSDSESDDEKCGTRKN